MLKVRKSGARGHANHGWLDSFHTFSFADYHEQEFMGFRDLRVINEDRIAGGGGFPTHPHRDMEIITYVIEGGIEHQDTLGTQSVIRPGEVQRMTAGSGIQHSEFNAFKDRTSHLLQIWILPERTGLKPGYEQKSFATELAEKPLVLVASRDGRQGSVKLNQNVNLYAAKWKDQGGEANFSFASTDRYGWVQVVAGQVDVSGQRLGAGDGLAIAGEKSIRFSAQGGVEFLFFDLA